MLEYQQQLKAQVAKGAGYLKRTYVRKAIDKYGWDSITSEVLFDNLSEQEACQKEIDLIKHYKSTDNEFGYNVSNGGNVAGKHSDETIQKIRESKIGAKNPMYGKASNEKQLAALAKMRMHNKGKPLSEETKQKIEYSVKRQKIIRRNKKKDSISTYGYEIKRGSKGEFEQSKKGNKILETHIENLKKAYYENCQSCLLHRNKNSLRKP